jgi:hypothetical protein
VCAERKFFPVEALREFSTRVFLHFGCPKEDAEQAADVLACADLRGIDSQLGPWIGGLSKKDFFVVKLKPNQGLPYLCELFEAGARDRWTLPVHRGPRSVSSIWRR